MERAWNTISRIYLIIRILSLDILAGVICGYTFARIILGSECQPLTPVFLGATVWLIYTLDHLLDARARQDRSTRPAYRWHHEKRRILWPVLLAAGLATAGLSLAFLPARIMIFGSLMGVLVAIYILVQQGMPGTRRIYLFKEGWISIIYTAGIWGVPLLTSGTVPGIPVWLAIIIYWLLVLINVLIYSYHDHHTDVQESQLTMATVAGKKATAHLLRLLILAVLMLIVVAFLILDDPAMGKVYFILMGMTTLLGGILAFPDFFSKKERYGVFADAVFFLPGWLFWIW